MIQFISGSFGFVERELVYQALVKDVDCEGKEALHWAAIKGHDAVAQILLANKAQVGKQGHIGGKSLLHVVFCQSYFYLRVPKDQAEFNVLTSEIFRCL